MARIRSVHPGLASDEAYMTMTMAAKAAWPLLWTEADDHGVFEWKPIVLKARIFPADHIDFETILSEYEALGCVRRVELEGRLFGLIRNFGKYQRPKNPSFRYPWSDDCASYCGFSVALPQPSPSPTEKRAQRKEEGGKREDVIEEESATAASSSAAAVETIDEGEVERRCIQATGWHSTTGFSAILDLIAEGHSLEDRILPMLRTIAGELRERGHPAPRVWAFAMKTIRDQTRHPACAAKRVESVWVPVGSPAWKSLATVKRETYLRSMVKPDGRGGEGIYWPAADLPKIGAAA